MTSAARTAQRSPRIEELRTAGGSHTLAWWKKKKYRYTGREGQTVIYLPRPDAYTKGYSDHNDADHKAEISINGTPITVDYPGVEVTEAYSATAGHVAISSISMVHPYSGKTVMLAKFGSALSQYDIVRVEYYPLFNFAVRQIADRPFSNLIGREDKAIFLVEVV
jgi:hypothetical protein